eukprot:1195026-Prorocentrum_minimum.AAC.2
MGGPLGGLSSPLLPLHRLSTVGDDRVDPSRGSPLPSSPYTASQPSEMIASVSPEELEAAGVESCEGLDETPGIITIRVLRAESLCKPGAWLTTSIDPYLELSYGGYSCFTEKYEAANNPVFNETFSL